jgi:hypothetical protein
MLLDRLAQAKVADRQHARPVRAEDQKHFGSPPAYALYLHQLLNHLLVRQFFHLGRL